MNVAIASSTFASTLPHWEQYPERPTFQLFSLKQRVFGPMQSHINAPLGLLARLLYGWFYTDDLYFARVDQELRKKHQ